MKKTLLTSVLSLIFLLVSTLSIDAQQLTVVSQDGYSVNISIHPAAIVKTNPVTGCADGYNYNVRLNYTVTYSGRNFPANGLYTLQGTLGCGSSSHFFDLPNGAGNGAVTSQSNVWNPNRDCATASVVSLQCNTATIQIEGPGIPNQFRTFALGENAPLPVKLIDFSAEAKKDQVNIKWSTATEINNDFFSVERSVDGISWTVIKTVKGAGNSSDVIRYETNDANPVAGVAYYRLKQTDLDGKFEYSDTKLARFNGVASVSVYPVPNNGNTINFKGIAEAKNIILAISDAAGISLFSTQLSSTTVTLPSLKPGLYIISLNNKLNGEITNLRYVKI